MSTPMLSCGAWLALPLPYLTVLTVATALRLTYDDDTHLMAIFQDNLG